MELMIAIDGTGSVIIFAIFCDFYDLESKYYTSKEQLRGQWLLDSEMGSQEWTEM